MDLSFAIWHRILNEHGRVAHVTTKPTRAFSLSPSSLSLSLFSASLPLQRTLRFAFHVLVPRDQRLFILSF